MTKLPEKNNIKRILIVQTAFLGDVVLITPLIRETKKLFPQAALDVLVIPQTKSVLDNNPNIDSIITFDKRKKKFREIIRTSRIIRKNHYDMAITPHSSMTTMILLLLGGVRTRIGFDRYTAGKFLTVKVPHLKNRLKIEKNLHLLSFWGDYTSEIDTELFPSSTDFQLISSLLPVDLQKPIAAIAPGSVWFTKRWPESYYKELVRKLNSLGWNIVFIGGPDEKELCERINLAIKQKGIVLAGKTSILQSAAALSHADILITNDSGALHLGNAMQIPVYAFFGPTVRSIGYYPYRETDHVFEVTLNCRPCGSHGHAKCPLEHHKCMKNITPESVLKKIVQDRGQ